MPERLSPRAVRSIIEGRVEVMGPRPVEVRYTEARLSSLGLQIEDVAAVQLSAWIAEAHEDYPAAERGPVDPPPGAERWA